MYSKKSLSVEELKRMEGKRVLVDGLEETYGIVKSDRVETKNFYYLFKDMTGIDKFYKEGE